MMAKVKKLVEQLDVATPFEEGNLHVYIVQNADVVEVLEALESLVTGASGPSRPQPGQPAVSGAVEAFAKEVRMSVYEPTNALLVTASPQDWKILQGVLEQIDVPERQVYVEAVIMEVTITDGVSVGVELAAIGEEDVVAATNFGNLANLIVQGPLGWLPTYTGGFGAALDGVVEVTDPLTGTPISIPKVPVLLTAIQTVTDLEVLSAPTLLTTKATSRRGGTTSGTGGRSGLGGTMGGTGGLGTTGRRGGGSSITVGKDVPVIRGSARPLAQESISPTLYNTVARQKVGVILEVAPHIIADDYIKLEIRVEVSDIIPTADPDIELTSGPTFSVSEIADTVVIRDGYMAIIGGLMSQAEDLSRSKLPLLGDIPGLGFFFRRSTGSKEKRNLVVIITPHIVKSGEDLEELTERYRKNYDLQKLEMYQDLNFWRKVFFKKKNTAEETSQTKEERRIEGEHVDRVMGRKSDW
jgi:general secretion pathway protein D